MQPTSTYDCTPLSARSYILIESRYTAKERDTESGLDYFGARYYGSTMGRFTSPDDGSDQSPGDPQSWNLYSYVRNNPLKNTDPTGNACVGGVDDDRGGETCAQVDAADAEYARQGRASATVTATPGDAVGSFLLNGFFALNNVANNYFAGLTGLRATSNISLGNDWTGGELTSPCKVLSSLSGQKEKLARRSISPRRVSHILLRGIWRTGQRRLERVFSTRVPM